VQEETRPVPLGKGQSLRHQKKKKGGGKAWSQAWRCSKTKNCGDAQAKHAFIYSLLQVFWR
jgi:hypothetical protein